MLLSRLHHREASAHKRSYDLYVCSDTKLAEEVAASFAHFFQVLPWTANTAACAVVTNYRSQKKDIHIEVEEKVCMMFGAISLHLLL